MPRKVVPTKSVKQVKEEISDTETNSNDSCSETTIQSQCLVPTMYLSSGSVKCSDSDRVHLAHAINNFTLKSEQFLQEMKNFDTFREKIFNLDLQIESKKQEHEQTVSSLQHEFTTKKKDLENHYAELTKKLKTEHDELVKKIGIDNSDKIKKCESEFADKNKQLTNTYEDESIKMRRKLEADKSNACAEYAKSLGMRFGKEEEYKALTDSVQKAVQDYTDLKKNFDKQCAQAREEERIKCQSKLENDTKTMELTHKANNAQLLAQVEQQKKEILVLNSTIENLKNELKEQRELTKQVAMASSKGQITQTIGK